MAKILVIEDSEVIRFVMTRILETLGHSAVTAATAREGLEKRTSEKPDAVFLDWDLPEVDALNFLKGVAAPDTSQRQPIILCATENDPKQFALARAAGAAFHILKPYDLASVRGALAEAGIGRSETPKAASAAGAA